MAKPKKLTASQQAIMDTLRGKEEAFLLGSFNSKRWNLHYKEGNFKPVQRVVDVTVRLLFENGYITLGVIPSWVGDQSLTMFVPTVDPPSSK